MLSNVGVMGLLPMLIVFVVIGVVLTAFLQIRNATRETAEKLDDILKVLTDIRDNTTK